MRSAALCLIGLLACKPIPHAPFPPTRVVPDRTYLRDSYDRYVTFRGVNLAGSSKMPASIDAFNIPSYVGRPFAPAKADAAFARMRDQGFNAVRLLVSWEGVSPEARGKYDQAYLDYLREMVQLAGKYGIYVLIDMHQDMFSRHLNVRYNSRPRAGDPGSLEYNLLALAEPYNDQVRGDGAPRWAVEACLQEKNLDSPNWGIPRIMSGLDDAALANVLKLYQKLTGASVQGDNVPPWVPLFLAGIPQPFAVNETTDMLPFTNWNLAQGLSLDVSRASACFFAGDQVFPGLSKDGVSVKEYLQAGYTEAWEQVAAAVGDQPNILGYDLMNEPNGVFLMLAAAAGVVRLGVIDGAKAALQNLFGIETGGEVYDAIVALRLLPPDATPETLALWGLDRLDILSAISINISFDDVYLRPMYERVGAAVQKIDSQAVFFLETSSSLGAILGGQFGGIGGMLETPMTRPNGLDRIVFAPHHYADIYPNIGFNVVPRTFSAEQVRYRDYQPKMESAALLASYSLGNVPVVFGEFGAYFNFNGISSSRAAGYDVTAHFLDNYYEAFERMFTSSMLWTYTPDNNFKHGDGWNHEDFSVIDPSQKPRAQLAWDRPYARALAGKPHTTHFYSDYHYFDFDKGIAPPVREFEVRYGSKESSAPTEIIAPPEQYPDGFYVWLSDGRAYFDATTHTLFHYPVADDPSAEHYVILRPPLPNVDDGTWRYFFDGKGGELAKN